MELIGPLISIMPSKCMSATPPAGEGQPLLTATPKFKSDDRYTVIGVDFGINWATDFDIILPESWTKVTQVEDLDSWNKYVIEA